MQTHIFLDMEIKEQIFELLMEQDLTEVNLVFEELGEGFWLLAPHVSQSLNYELYDNSNVAREMAKTTINSKL